MKIYQNGRALGFASEEFKKDKEIIMVVVKQNGMLLQYASEELKKDKDVVLAAVTQNIMASQYANFRAIFTEEQSVWAFMLKKIYQ
jgi:endonuclease V-like protein UPF0215 family